MDEKTKKLIKEKFDALPKSIQEIILSSNYENSLAEIGQQHKLNVGQLGILERETTLVMMGLTPTKDFENELTRELNVGKETGAQIVKDINEKIFIRIRELLKIMNTPLGENPSTEENNPKIEEKETINTDHNEEDKIMQSAGIEIDRNGFTKTNKVLTNKLLDSVKIPVTHTDHSLTNITPAEKISENTPKVMSDIKKTSDGETKPTSYGSNKDPYRLSPDE